MNKAKLAKQKHSQVSRDAANAERAIRPAPDFLGAVAGKDWQGLSQAARVYVWRRLDELHAAPARREAKLAASLGLANADDLRVLKNGLEPFARHAAEREMTLVEYLAFFAGNEAKARDGDMIGALKNLLSFTGLDAAKLGRGMLSLWAMLHLPRFDTALATVYADFVSRQIEFLRARLSIVALAAGANDLGLVLASDASRFDVRETAP